MEIKIKKRLIQGIGINDANYVTQPTIDGKLKKCKIYQTWQDMFNRCYSPTYLSRFPTYMGCSVEKGWHSFMCFRGWMLNQNYEGKQLDKDLLIPGNKVYSEDTCCFISRALNMFMTEGTSIRGGLPLGVSINGNKYMSRCNNPFTKTSKCLGTFNTVEEAHQAWKQYKHELALQYAKLETDPRIITALQTRYLN